MTITRLIYITIDPADTDRAMQVWKKECAPLMIQQKGCISERLLRSRDAHEFISCSEWESETDIEMYAHSQCARGDRTPYPRPERRQGAGEALRSGDVATASYWCLSRLPVALA